MSDKMISLSALTFMRLVLYYSGGYQFNFEGMFTEPQPIGKKLKKQLFELKWIILQIFGEFNSFYMYMKQHLIIFVKDTYALLALHICTLFDTSNIHSEAK